MKKKMNISAKRIKPKDFDFDLNRGRVVSLYTKDNNVQTGTLYDLMSDDIIIIRFQSKNGNTIHGLYEVFYENIKSIILC